MTLVLAIRRGPPGVPLERREVTGTSFRIGRGAECDWRLADPHRVLSKCHCRLVADGEQWQIVDTSSNGTLLNGRSLDPASVETLRDGDSLVLGSYDIEARLEHPVDRLVDTAGPARSTEDAFPRPPMDGFDFLLDDGDPRTPFEPVAIDLSFSDRSELAADRASDLHEHVRLPRPAEQLIPEDWDAPAPPSPVREPASEAPPPTPPPSLPWTDAPTPDPARGPPIPSPNPGRDTDDDDASARGFAVLAGGAGIEQARVADPDATLRALGAAFRALVVELRKTMMARAAIKSEFRIQQTMLLPAGNNPLKFAVDDHDALSALLGTGRRTGMQPDRAVADALRDIRLHELATAVAMQRAMREMLDALSPGRIERDVPAVALDGVAGRRASRLWHAFAERHARVVGAIEDDFDSAFGKSFARAYEAALLDAERADGGPVEPPDAAGEDGRA